VKKILFRLLYFIGGIFALSTVAVAILFALPRPNFEMAEPRDFPWPLTPFRDEMYSATIRQDGKLEILLQHDVLPEVTPAMLAWWYQQLPLGAYQTGDKTYTYYHLFHPSEHGVIEVLEAGEGPGISKGALVIRRERFGQYYSKGKARVITINPDGMIVSPEVAGLHFGRITHRFTAKSDGTAYTVHAILGSDLPLLGPVVNLYIRNRLFPEPVLKEWMRHQTEEVGSLPFYLPALFQKENE
jgi:hypothetical protein